jgi:lysophospholipid acyltransferase (LPLAT)-like uncharacterized protein
MGVVKALTRSRRVRQGLCWLAAQYIRLVHATGRWEVVGGDIADGYWDRGEPFVLAFWHGRILMMPYCWRRGVPINMLISQHRDGQIIAQTVKHFDIETIAGSSSRGGAGALRSLVKSLKAGRSVGVTPDGPRGPRMRVSDGVAQLARLAGAPVIPCTFSARRHRLASSWDRFMVALPFSRGVFVWGSPIGPPKEGGEAAMAMFAQAIESEMNAITRAADERMGVVPVEPAPPVGAPLSEGVS